MAGDGLALTPVPRSHGRPQFKHPQLIFDDHSKNSFVRNNQTVHPGLGTSDGQRSVRSALSTAQKAGFMTFGKIHGSFERFNGQPF